MLFYVFGEASIDPFQEIYFVFLKCYFHDAYPTFAQTPGNRRQLKAP
jgi:hypothetical protein